MQNASQQNLEEIFVRLMNDESYRKLAISQLMRAVYQQIRTSGKAKQDSR